MCGNNNNNNNSSNNAGCKYKPTTWYSSWGKKLEIQKKLQQLQNLSMVFREKIPLEVDAQKV